MRPRPGAKANGLTADWKHPTEIRFGVGRCKELPEICWNLGICSPLLVTDAGVAKLPFIRRIKKRNREESIETEVFSDLASEPDAQSVNRGAVLFRKGGFDGIIAVGGGSALDAGKAISLAAAVGPSGIWSYAATNAYPPSTSRKIHPIVAVPTTSGTGSEVDANAVITDPRSHRKVSLCHPELLPKVVVADPQLTRGLIPYLTASTGMDALSHNLEALCSPLFHPILDAVALQGIAYIKDWLPMACREGKRLQPRVFTMAASIMGAIAFEKGLGAMHAIAHAIGGSFKINHGRAIGAIMPYVLKANRTRIREKMAHVARYLDLPHHDFDAVLNWIVELRRDLGMPSTLRMLGVRKEHVPDLVRLTLEDVNIRSNPMELNERKVRRVLLNAVEGKL